MSSVLSAGTLYVAGQDPQNDRDSDFATGALRDGVVSAQEYAQANEAVISCAKDRDVPLTTVDRHGIVVFASSRGDASDTLDACDAGGIATVRVRYKEQYQDPAREGDEVWFRCLEAQGLIAPDDGARAEPLSVVADRLMKDDADPVRSELADRCMYDPIGRSGG